jgi:Fe-S-cluster containining protein
MMSIVHNTHVTNRLAIMKPIQRYFELLNRIDTQTKRLTALHGKALVCRPGCTSCCRNLSVFPVEFHAIRHAMARAGTDPKTVPFDTSASCGFLNEGLCRIYPFRPIICRTHGLPILFLDDSSGEYAWEVSFCELNFTGRGDIEFTDDMLLDIEEINTELSRINRDFIALKEQEKEHPPQRIPLKALCTPSGGKSLCA